MNVSEITGAATHIPCGTFTIDNNRVYEIVGVRELEPPNLIIADYKPFPGIVIEDAAGTFRFEIPFSEAPITSEADYHQSMIADD